MSDEPRSEPGHGTPEGYTPEKPAPSEIGKPGTPGAVEDDSAAAADHHDAATHMDAHTTLSDDDHGHAEPALGPIDWGAWAYALVGAGAGLVVVAFFWFAVR